MNHELKSEIQALAKQVLEMNGVAPLGELQMVAKDLYDKVTILKYITENPSVSNQEVPSLHEVVKPVVDQLIEEENLIDEIEDDNLEDQQMLSTLDENLFVSNEPMDESLIESATEKIKDIVAQMPPEAEQIEEFIQEVVAPTIVAKNDIEEITPLQEDIAVVTTNKQQQSLNDRLKKSITIGLNDRIAFVKHLFNGSTEDFNRVISQLNTLSSELEALEFLNNMVKPEYNGWIGKEDYEQRFLSFIEGRYV
ncbi:hypothetical protein [Pseudofulvibacter geojedonensis]|uniref:Uncharacterized protein n=1 Tax=Pseudofulvibacter geojedonensis TaxID=1123758 RepID=A0ABW3I0V5_9FLAO